MKRVPAELTSKVRWRPDSELPRVLVATGSTAASSPIAQALRRAGYVVNITPAGVDVVSHLRSQTAIELLVLDGSGGAWAVGSAIDSFRAIIRALPIILISPRDSALRAEAERLGVEAILDAPVGAEEIRRVAQAIVPVGPEIELDLAG